MKTARPAPSRTVCLPSTIPATLTRNTCRPRPISEPRRYPERESRDSLLGRLPRLPGRGRRKSRCTPGRSRCHRDNTLSPVGAGQTAALRSRSEGAVQTVTGRPRICSKLSCPVNFTYSALASSTRPSSSRMTKPVFVVSMSKRYFSANSRNASSSPFNLSRMAARRVAMPSMGRLIAGP